MEDRGQPDHERCVSLEAEGGTVSSCRRWRCCRWRECGGGKWRAPTGGRGAVSDTKHRLVVGNHPQMLLAVLPAASGDCGPPADTAATGGRAAVSSDSFFAGGAPTRTPYVSPTRPSSVMATLSGAPHESLPGFTTPRTR